MTTCTFPGRESADDALVLNAFLLQSQKYVRERAGMYIICLTGIRSFQVPLTFRPGNRYHVTVRGLRSRTSVVMTSDTDAAAAAAAADTTTTFEVTLKGSTEFRTGEGWYAQVHLMPIETDM